MLQISSGRRDSMRNAKRARRVKHVLLLLVLAGIATIAVGALRPLFGAGGAARPGSATFRPT
jgi:hypothetical protein